MSKHLFEQMREAEIATANFLPTKKEIQVASKAFVNKMIHSGEFNLQEKLAQALRLKEALSVIEAQLRDALPDETFEAFGIKGTYRNSGAVLNFEEDEIYADLKNQLKKREDILKLAQNEIIYDSEGIEVPKVSKTERKSSLSISF